MPDPEIFTQGPLPRTLRFFVPGTPATKGNMRAFNAGGRVKITEKKTTGLTTWLHAINDEARRVRGDQEPFTGPLSVELWFWLQRPASEPKRRRTWPTKARSGDVDKLARAALDAMTGVLFADDAQVVNLVVGKDFADDPFKPRRSPGVDIDVTEVSA
jgi:crossover junction endodeoxyribonuclease RusA